MASMQFALTGIATGEVRDAEGNLLSTEQATHVEPVEVDLDELRDAVTRRNLTDEQLRELGFTDDHIAQIRSDS